MVDRTTHSSLVVPTTTNLAPVKIGAAPARLKSKPSWLINQAALPAQRLVSDALTGMDASRQHYAVLTALDEFGPDSQAALGRRCGIDRSDMVALVDQLSAGELAVRSADAADRRRNIISITPGGQRLLGELDDLFATVQDRLLAPLTGGERDQLVALLTRIVEHHG
jgi:MarR family transcriptional regulator, lower aerobic nicotinate degradation pathway regulator